MTRSNTSPYVRVFAALLLTGGVTACASAGGTGEDQEEREVGRVLPDIGSQSDVSDTAVLDAAIIRDVDQADAGQDVSIEPGTDADADSVSDVTADARPDVAADAQPDIARDTIGDTRPDAAPDATPDTVQDAAPDAPADTGADVAPDSSPDVVADTTVDTGPDAAPDTTPDVALVELCDNLVDDDDDGTIDCGDADCADDPACTSVGDPCGPITTATVGVNSAVATADNIDVTCALQPGPEAVFRFTPSAAGTYCLRTDDSGVLDTVLEGRLDCENAGTVLGCFDDNDDGLYASSDLVAEAGTPYDLIVESYSGTAGDAVSLTITEGSCVDAGPGFETCSNPFVVSAYGEYGGPAFSDDHDGSCSDGGTLSYEAVIEFVAPETTRVCADTVGSTTDTVLWVQTSCDPGSEIACEDDSDGLGLLSAVSWEAVAGESYFVFVEEYASDGFIGEAFFAYNIAACP